MTRFEVGQLVRFDSPRAAYLHAWHPELYPAPGTKGRVIVWYPDGGAIRWEKGASVESSRFVYNDWLQPEEGEE